MNDQDKRAQVLLAWSEQPRPTLLAPTIRAGDLWIGESGHLFPQLRRRPYVVSPRNAETALRGYSGMLVVVTFGDRGGEPHPDMDRLWTVLHRIVTWGRFSTWTEVLP